MDPYESILSWIFDSSIVASWTELKNLLVKAGSREPREWQLPMHACLAAGGSREEGIPPSAAVACLQTSIILVDDILDADPRGVHQTIGAPACANLAVALQATGLDAVARSEADPEIRFAAVGVLNRMMATTCFGQHLDVQSPETEEDYWRVVRTKSSPFFAAALHVGALFGGASNELAAQFNSFGELYGEMIQIHDDLNDTMEVPANPDWILDRAPLPILFAQVVDHADKARFLELRRTVSDPAALKEAQNILIRCGAVSYCIDQLLRRHRAARVLLESTSAPLKEELVRLLERILEPVKKLVESINPSGSANLLVPPDQGS